MTLISKTFLPLNSCIPVLEFCITESPYIFVLIYHCYLIRQTEDSHVKTNTVHTLFRVRKYGLMSLDKFTEVLSPSDLRKCKRAQKQTWYSLPLEVFTSFIFQVRIDPSYSKCQLSNSSNVLSVISLNLSILFWQHEISVAADEGIRLHQEQSDGDVTLESTEAAMRKAVEDKIQKLRMKMGKLVAVSNPELTDGWLQEVLFPSRSSASEHECQ